MSLGTQAQLTRTDKHVAILRSPAFRWLARFENFGRTLSVSALLSALALAGQSANVNPATVETRFVYIFDESGAFAKIDLSDGKMAAYWNLSWANSPSQRIPDCHGSSVADSACNLLSGGLRRGEMQSLYGVVPTADSLGRNGQNLNYQVVKIQLPETTISNAFSIPEPQAEWPSLVVDQLRNRLFVSYREPDQEKKAAEPTVMSVVDVYDDKTFKKLYSIRESTPIKDIRQLKSNPGSVFGLEAYFSPDGTTLFDGLYVTRVSDTAMSKSYVNPLDKLSPEQRESLKPFQRKDPATQNPYLDFAAGDSAAGRTVVRVSNYSRGQAVYWTIDLNTTEPSPLIPARFGIDRLSPDGRVLLIQQGELNKTDAGTEVMAMPQFWAYDVATGRQISQFTNTNLPEIASRSEISCISPSGKQLVLVADGTVYLLSMPDGNLIAQLSTDSLGRPAGQCLFVDN